MLSRQNVDTPEQISDKHYVGHRVTDKPNRAANQEGRVIRILGRAHEVRRDLHDAMLTTGWAEVISCTACVFSAVEGLHRVHDVPDERHLEHLYHKSDNAIDRVIIAGFSGREDDPTGDDRQNQERGEQSDKPVSLETRVPFPERALRID